MRGKYLNIKINNTESEQIGIILGNHLLYDKSMKFGTYWEHDLRIILSKKTISNLTSDLCGSFFFWTQIADKVLNSPFYCHLDHYT